MDAGGSRKIITPTDKGAYCREAAPAPVDNLDNDQLREAILVLQTFHRMLISIEEGLGNTKTTEGEAGDA